MANMEREVRGTWVRPLLVTPICPKCKSDMYHTGQIINAPGMDLYMHACIADPLHEHVDFPAAYPRLHHVPVTEATDEELAEIEV